MAPCGQQETLRASQLSALCPQLKGWRGFNGGEVSGVAPLPTKLWGTLVGGLTKGRASPKDQPGLNWGPSNVFLLYKNQVQVLLPLPSGSQTAPLFFRAADCESQSLKREAKYIPLVNEEIKIFKSRPSGSRRKAAWGVRDVVTLVPHPPDTRALGLAHTAGGAKVPSVLCA